MNASPLIESRQRNGGDASFISPDRTAYGFPNPQYLLVNTKGAADQDLVI